MSSRSVLSEVQIPVIDFAAFVVGDMAQQRSIAKEIYQACHRVGFLYLKNYGISQQRIETVFKRSKQFFDLPLEVKNQLAWLSELSNRGYIGIERERLDPNQPGDLKEAFNLSQEGPIDAPPHLGEPPALVQNLWPPDAEFRQTMLEFFDLCSLTADRVLRAFALALQLPEAFMVEKHSNREHVLRLLHYPPMNHEPQPGQIRAGAHSDYGTLTLLFQDQVGGLEVRTTAGDWILAPCIPDTVLVNTGDLMQRWSNNVFCSTNHRVRAPTGDRAATSRYSIAFFCHPNYDTEICCIDSCCGPNQPPLYPPVLAGDYLLSLLQATY